MSPAMQRGMTLMVTLVGRVVTGLRQRRLPAGLAGEAQRQARAESRTSWKFDHSGDLYHSDDSHIYIYTGCTYSVILIIFVSSCGSQYLFPLFVLLRRQVVVETSVARI